MRLNQMTLKGESPYAVEELFVMQDKLKIIYFVVDNVTPQSYHRRVLMSRFLRSGRRGHIPAR